MDAKRCNQMMGAVNMAGVAQALLLASAGGAEPARIPEALSGGHAYSRVLQEHGRRRIERDFRPGAQIRNFVKDLNTVLETASDLNGRLPIVETIRDVFQDLYDKGMTQHDHSAFLLHLEDMNAPVRLGTGADTVPE